MFYYIVIVLSLHDYYKPAYDLVLFTVQVTVV